MDREKKSGISYLEKGLEKKRIEPGGLENPEERGGRYCVGDVPHGESQNRALRRNVRGRRCCASRLKGSREEKSEGYEKKQGADDGDALGDVWKRAARELSGEEGLQGEGEILVKGRKG